APARRADPSASREAGRAHRYDGRTANANGWGSGGARRRHGDHRRLRDRGSGSRRRQRQAAGGGGRRSRRDEGALRQAGLHDMGGRRGGVRLLVGPHLVAARTTRSAAQAGRADARGTQRESYDLAVIRRREDRVGAAAASPPWASLVDVSFFGSGLLLA